MSELGKATVKVVPDLTGFGEALSGAVDAAIESIGEKDIKIMVDGSSKPVRSYGPDGALVAEITKDEGFLDESARPALAKTIEVVNRRGRFSLKIDGQEFPWFITDDGVTTQIGPASMSSVTVTILADRVTVDDDWR